MGLGGVAIAVLPSVVYPQTVVLGQAGGVIPYIYSIFRPLTPPYVRFRIRRFLFWIPFEIRLH